MTTVEQLLGEFADAWVAGDRPDAQAFLDRAGSEADRTELAAQIESWVMLAPAPDYDDAALAAIRSEPALAAALAAAEAQSRALGVQVAALRERAGLATRALAEQLARRFGIDDLARTTGYVEQLESGALDERRISRRLLFAIEDLLGAGSTLMRPAPAGGALLMRSEDPAAAAELSAALEALSEAALEPAPDDDLDELDRLFCGGPEA